MANQSGKEKLAPTHKCSFCGKKDVEVAGLMFAGPGVSICQDCVLLCVEIVFERLAKTDEQTAF
ncbi:ClpX C4-type zinc finger protein [Pluralibacter gergoviae]|uniref:ClpX C4-type zinc finger protein n=1 Tax=Pluralibacter gergoviae TaxID=61647 RepID=UPI0007DAD7B8|nr:ClpX C4-type zinc finger protein [Pluralibacter gergoviae]SUB71826.1 ATP-dependent Clp protease ATP-binding subunit ClpX [Pluralibacter gergoviae]HDS1113651.1 hypothetical protein [Pluralibacter gergoviae]